MAVLAQRIEDGLGAQHPDVEVEFFFMIVSRSVIE